MMVIVMMMVVMMMMVMMIIMPLQFQNKNFQTYIPLLFGKTFKMYIFVFFFPNLKLSCAIKCQGTDAKHDQNV